MTVTPSHEELFNIEPKPGALDPRCRTGRVLCIDKTSRTLRWVIDGKVVKTMDARFGSTLNDTPTREGLFHVQSMDADHVSNLYGSSMPFAMFFSGGQAVHYSSDFATYGYGGASHGCVNIRDYDGIQWLFSQVRVGDKVVVYWS
jgi:lipoprotein-anchoring transpeptidase ErfK/SrfK